MPLDGVADFAAGVCASAIKPANDASTSPIKKALSKFMLAFVFRTSQRVQPHQIKKPRDKRDRTVGLAVLCTPATQQRGAHGLIALPKRGPSVGLRPTRVRSEHNKRFFHPPQRRGRQYGSCNAGKQAPARESRTRNCRTYDVLRQRPLQTPCHIRFRKLRIYPYTSVRARRGWRRCPIFCEIEFGVTASRHRSSR